MKVVMKPKEAIDYVNLHSQEPHLIDYWKVR